MGSYQLPNRNESVIMTTPNVVIVKEDRNDCARVGGEGRFNLAGRRMNNNQIT